MAERCAPPTPAVNPGLGRGCPDHRLRAFPAVQIHLEAVGREAAVSSGEELLSDVLPRFGKEPNINQCHASCTPRVKFIRLQ
ncbi:hypothetical protein NDU88_002957 [Pleurodeles waltl]|uniref:Uncharacterized protein n=1 Tax=Pleurodeles waltl TaxID=8319 RepID=A0AAV7WS63_PLEWA|nr:hypothetical protein NDU88_002957 [Pleurodeles waltl]